MFLQYEDTVIYYDKTPTSPTVTEFSKGSWTKFIFHSPYFSGAEVVCFCAAGAQAGEAGAEQPVGGQTSWCYIVTLKCRSADL